MIDVWQKATRQNGLFLSTAIQLNNEQLKPVFNWFQQKLAVILPVGDINLQFSIEQCASEDGKKQVMEFMNSADISITGIELKKTPFSSNILPTNMPKEIKEHFIRDLHGKEVTNIRFYINQLIVKTLFHLIFPRNRGAPKSFLPLLALCWMSWLRAVFSLLTNWIPVFTQLW